MSGTKSNRERKKAGPPGQPRRSDPEHRGPSSSSGESVEVAGSGVESASGEALPEGWASATLEELCELNPKHPKETPDELEVSFVPMAAVSDKTGTITDATVRPFGDVRKGYTQFADGDVIFAKITPCMENGKAASVRDLKNGLACGTTEFYVFRQRGALNQDYLFKFIRQESYRKLARAQMQSGVGQARVPKEFVLGTELPVPPLAEQSRIVSAIESLQERSSRARDLLSEVGPLIGQLRQSVLRGAFSGRLTAAWREQHRSMGPWPVDTEIEDRTSPTPVVSEALGTQVREQPEYYDAAANDVDGENAHGPGAHATYETAHELLQRIRTERRASWEAEQLAKYEAKGKKPPKNWQDKYKEPEPVDESELPELPEGWCWAAAEEIVEPGIDIVYGIVQPGPNLDDGIPYVRGLDIQNGTILVDQLWNTSEKIAERYARSALAGGDVLLGIIRHTKVAVVPESISGGNMGRATARFRPASVIKSQFLAGALESPDIQRWMLDQSRGIDMPIINVGDVRRTPIPLAPMEEQMELIERLAVALQSVSEVESGLASMESSLTQLDQSILSKAFRGELVPQDPRDEPASELLARIRTTREAESARKTQKRRSKKA